MRHRYAYITLLTCLFIISTCSAHSEGSFGLGLILGDPTGVSWKYHFHDRNAIDGAIGFSPFDRMRIHVDYLWITRPFNEHNLSLSYGVGGVLGFGARHLVGGRGGFGYFTHDASVAARIPVGLTYAIPRSPVELGIELAPLVIFGPVGGLGMDGGIFVRFYP